MAYVVSNQQHVAYADGTSKTIVEVRCDTPEDLPTASANWLTGSVAWIVSTGDFYGLNSSGEWIQQES